MNINKIGVFRALQLGDLLCAVPAFRSLRFSYPYAEITLIGLPWAETFATRFANYIDHFISFPGFEGLSEQPFNLDAFQSFLTIVESEAFDLVIQLHGNGKITNKLVQMFDAKVLAGSFTKESINPNPSLFWEYEDTLPEIDRALSVVEMLGGENKGKYLEFPITSSERMELEQFSEYQMLQKRSYVCIHPGARDEKRRWDIEKFASVADTLIVLGYPVVITGSSDETYLAEDLINAMDFPPINFSGKLSLGGTAALLQTANLVISNCTSISHLSDALGVPSVIIFLNSDPIRWAPLDELLHRPIMKDNATPDLVLQEALWLLETNQRRRVFQGGML